MYVSLRAPSVDIFDKSFRLPPNWNIRLLYLRQHSNMQLDDGFKCSFTSGVFDVIKIRKRFQFLPLKVRFRRSPGQAHGQDS